MPAVRPATPRSRFVATLALSGVLGAACGGTDARLAAADGGVAPDDPNQAWLLDWGAYESQDDLFAGPVGPRQGGRAWPIVLDEEGPWGTTGALQIFFPRGPADRQPENGVNWSLPDSSRTELWLETWLRYDPWWTSGPHWPNDPNQERVAMDHKLMYFWQGTYRENEWWPNWQLKDGVWGDWISAAWHPDVWYRYAHDPVREDFGVDRATAIHSATALYDGAWHHLRIHVRAATDGYARFALTLDGRTVIDSGPLAIDDDTPFTMITFGSNRNTGNTEDMSLYFGPARVFLSDPGWR